MKRICVQVQLTDMADVHREVRAGVLGQHPLRPDRRPVEPAHVERPETGERHEHLVAYCQIAQAVAVQLQHHKRFVQVLDRFPDQVL